jgi:hypothetical protein
MMSRFPVAFRPAGIGFLAIRCPLGSWAFLAVGLPGLCWHPDPIGVATFHTCELRPGWVPSLPRGRWCSHGRLLLPGRHLPHRSGKVPIPRSCFHRPRLHLTRHH